ncbi:hypothetical protein [Microbacterium sp. LWH11-1.2]|uniref:hypothetical protein n=1 Tax=Microbacterium sp. LWH11-1.2 TaxID=3135258 RepID=UPI00313A01E2
MSTYRDNTLAPDDIEWVWPNDFEDVKDAVYDDEQFAMFLIGHGLIGALTRVHEFHRLVANQLIVRAVDTYTPVGWVGRTIRLSRRVKRRRNELQRLLTAEIGAREAEVVFADLKQRFPRAEWGSALEKNT